MMYKIKEFYNDSCGACKLLKPVLERVANESNAELTFINVDENPHYISEFDIKTLPYVRITYEDNSFVEFNGYRPYGAIKKIIDNKK